ncbi:MAG: hypothetical protein AAGG01_12185 [Planctomycetota bacterium]
MTADGGASWQDVSKGLPRKTIQRVHLSIHSPTRAYACLSGANRGDHQPYVYVSNDFGSSWRSIASGLPTRGVNVLVESSSNPMHLYVATDLGVYESRDAGATWSSLSKSLPTVPVMDLALHEEEGSASTLIAVTHGLSAFSLRIEEARRTGPADD